MPTIGTVNKNPMFKCTYSLYQLCKFLKEIIMFTFAPVIEVSRSCRI